MIDIGIIGSGFWGLTCALFAKRYGLETLLIDNHKTNSGSRNAAGIITPSWFTGTFFSKISPHWWEPKYIDYGIEQLQELAGIVNSGEDILVAYGKDYGKKKNNPPVWMLPDLNKYLRSFESVLDSVFKVNRVSGGWEIIGREGKITTSKNVIIAAGIWTEKLLLNSGLKPVNVEPLGGRAIIFGLGGNRQIQKPLRVLRGPYKHITFRPWGETSIRVGDTVELVENKNKLTVLTEECDSMFPDSGSRKVILGYRPVTGRIVVEKIDDGLIVATGAHRIGFALSPIVAKRSLQLLGIAIGD
ncbi:FAD-binding oxidoreductase [Candidatus Parcubacteria bacterium]|nr:MAG: FAD-binding oxidoreductase [Candidatus Parcubacteria bacterium]